MRRGTRLHLNARVFDVREDTFFLEGRLRELLARVDQLARDTLPAELTVQIWSGSVAALRLTEVLVRDHLISIAVALVLVFAVAAHRLSLGRARRAGAAAGWRSASWSFSPSCRSPAGRSIR